MNARPIRNRGSSPSLGPAAPPGPGGSGPSSSPPPRSTAGENRIREDIMQYRTLGRSGLKVSVLTLGTMTFGGTGPFAKVGNTDLHGARRQIDLCLDAGVNLFDTADIYSTGLSEQIVGEALEGRRDAVLVATKARFPMAGGPNDAGSSRHHLIRACEASLKRLRTDTIDLYQLHERDGVHAAGGNHGGARPPRALRQGALRRRVELLRLAPDEGDGHHRAPPPSAPDQPADPLHAAGARGGVRAGAGLARPGARHHGVGARSPAASCPASTGAARRRPRARGSWRSGPSRRCATPTRCTTSSRRW